MNDILKKKDFEDAVKTYLDEGINYHANTIKRAEEGDITQLAYDSFFYGAVFVLNYFDLEDEGI